MHVLLNGPGFATSVGLVAAVLMIRLGVVEKALELRKVDRSCSACGRRYTGRACPWCIEG